MKSTVRSMLKFLILATLLVGSRGQQQQQQQQQPLTPEQITALQQNFFGPSASSPPSPPPSSSRPQNQPQSTVVRETFTQSPGTTSNCPCVPAYECRTPFYGEGLIDPRIPCVAGEVRCCSPATGEVTRIPALPLINDCPCTPLNQCYPGGANYGEGVINVRIGECPDSSTDVKCCNRISPAPTENPSNAGGGGGGGGQIPDNPNFPFNGGGTVTVDEPQPTPQSPPPTVPYQRSGFCGVRNTRGVGFRISGIDHNDAFFGEFPWMMAILRSETKMYLCGGSLIHPRVVLTVTHCVLAMGPNEITVRAGEWDSLTEGELIPFQERRVERIISSSNYNTGNLANDITLLLLESPFDFADNVDVICLPDHNEKFEGDNSCLASGWGKDKFGIEGKFHNILKKVTLPIPSREDCTRRLRMTHLGPNFVLHETFICAGGKKGEDTCEGDGGSPLVCPRKRSQRANQYTVAGMVAWGIGCNNDIPAAYVNVAHFRNWIDLQLAAYDINDLADYQS